MTDIENLTLIVDSEVSLDLNQDSVTQLSILEDEQFSSDLDNNLDNSYLKVYVDEQDAVAEPLVIYRDMAAAHEDQAGLNSYYMSHAGRFRIVKSSRTWFTSNLRNRYSAAGRLF